MIFVINNLKYDTDKMSLISEKCRYKYESKSYLGTFYYYGKNVKLWRSKKDNWLLTDETEMGRKVGEALPISKVRDLLLKHDLSVYEDIFGELEEA